MQANLPYVLWITAFNTSFLFLYLVVHLVATRRATLNGTRGIHDPPPPPVAAPAIFRAINQNGLVVFLVVRIAPTHALT